MQPENEKQEYRIIHPYGISFMQRIYCHEALREFVGHRVRVKTNRGDISKVTVSLPNGESCEPQLLAVQRLLAPGLNPPGPPGDEPPNGKGAEGRPPRDRRRAPLSKEVADWLNAHWTRYRTVTEMYRALKLEAEKQGWMIPKRSWLYRYWHHEKTALERLSVTGAGMMPPHLQPPPAGEGASVAAVLTLHGKGQDEAITVLLSPAMLKQLWTRGLSEMFTSRQPSANRNAGD